MDVMEDDHPFRHTLAGCEHKHTGSFYSCNIAENEVHSNNVILIYCDCFI